MTYADALKLIYESTDHEVFSSNPFLIYSLLSDKTAGSFQDSKLSRLYFDINQQLNVLQMFEELGVKEGLNALVKLFYKFKTDVDKVDYKICVRGIVDLIDPEYFKDKPLKLEEPKKVAIVKRNSKPVKGKNPVVSPKSAPNSTKISNNNFCATPLLQLDKKYFIDLKGVTDVVISAKHANVNIEENGGGKPNVELINSSKRGDKNLKFRISYSANNSVLQITVDTTSKKRKPYTLSISGMFKDVENLTIESSNYVTVLADVKNLNIKAKQDITYLGVSKELKLVSDADVFAESSRAEKINILTTKGKMISVTGGKKSVKLSGNHTDIYYKGSPKEVSARNLMGLLKLKVPLLGYTKQTYMKNGYRIRTCLQK